jgi:hypothetical protein
LGSSLKKRNKPVLYDNRTDRLLSDLEDMIDIIYDEVMEVASLINPHNLKERVFLKGIKQK